METTPQDNRKRALDALEQRFTVAKAELLKQKRKKEVESEKERGRKVNILPEHLPDAQGAKAKSSMVSARRGVVSIVPHRYLDSDLSFTFQWLFFFCCTFL